MAASTASSGSGPSSGKPRSCVLCAKRKVSCDKQYPCGRCQRAGIRCVLPVIDQRPRWVRRLVAAGAENARSAPHLSSPLVGGSPDQTQDKIKHLEGMIQNLHRELEQARTSSTEASSFTGNTAATSTTHPPDHSSAVSERRADLNGHFWSRVDNELADFRDDAPEPVDEDPEMSSGNLQPQTKQTMDPERSSQSAMSRRSIFSSHSPTTMSQDTSTFFPLPSQIPFILEIYSERVHCVMCIPHMPTLKKLLQRNRIKSKDKISASEETLLFAVFYASICSLDDEEVQESFNAKKSDMLAKYHRGLETALAKAEFLNNPSDDIVQALLIFLGLARLHESTKYLWMMTGLNIRMARFLRYHEDGSTSKRISPFQAEMQRRVWWNLCALDLRATEDQGTELAIPDGSFTTSLPSNIEEGDLWPEMEQAPTERPGLTGVSLLRLCSKVGRGTQKMIGSGSTATFEDHVRLLDDLAQELDRDFFSVANQSSHHAYLAAAGTMRVFLGRLTLLAFLPTLCASPGANFSTDLRNKLLVAGIEIAELNHALNTEPSCQPWRWVYQTTQHWHAVVFLLLEICRSPWSPTIERAWFALQSPWLLPARAPSYQNPSVWVPLRKLMTRARSHREQELIRLRNDSNDADQLERDEREQMPVPSSSVTFPMYYDEEMFRKRWRQLVDQAPATTPDSALATISNAPQNRNANTLDIRDGSFSTDLIRTQGSSDRIVGNDPTTSATLPSVQATGSSANPWAGEAMNLTNSSNLDSFLGTGSEMDFPDVLNDEDFFNFDWNSWFESVNGTL